MEKGIVIYSEPKKGIFSRHGLYIQGKGWDGVHTESLIIGEDDYSYIYGFVDTEDGKIKLGWAKSRLIRWEGTQLSLF